MSFFVLRKASLEKAGRREDIFKNLSREKMRPMMFLSGAGAATTVASPSLAHE
jgi:hypothetical protein